MKSSFFVAALANGKIILKAFDTRQDAHIYKEIMKHSDAKKLAVSIKMTLATATEVFKQHWGDFPVVVLQG